ncbi:hypothetical protein ASPZODRAFT_62473 [Penicilliopsis zonata CBS 506.65]|uniref:Haloacid dehalogenase-like hydrolase domain-containing protein 3 n=1 Tax=Penicilliopsis zonata CBS 506.65 TaxID=1073090 RepID=A0A1L9SNM7_9EURO|nr:hypothetical protein ASPZODRAFT_62473 [Penicilliopsis zonata CBS 506.65]OJJ48713.1 hypothetical protein ASPZODRAFT_62473 [Penicilliopsis zonata CBS 506.65]
MPRTLLLTLDAFGTLFHPRLPIPDQYAATAHSFGLTVSPSSLKSAFKESFKAQSILRPNYGRADVLRGEYAGPRQWWEEVIRASFARAIPSLREDEIPNPLVEGLIHRFASREGYVLFDDARLFFHRMRLLRETTAVRVYVGVLSNSDDRVASVLDSLGVKVNKGGDDYRHDYRDVDFVLTSYEAGEEKPHRLIFDTARSIAQKIALHSSPSADWTCLHVGDDREKDYEGALRAGWTSYHLQRDQDGHPEDIQTTKNSTVHSLLDVLDKTHLS